MDKLKQKIEFDPLYTDFSETNEKILSELTATLREIINDLSSRNLMTDEIFSKLSDSIEVSNAVFRSFSSHEGLELVLRLKSVAALYRKNMNENSSLIKTAEHIIKKLDKFNSTFFHEATSDEIVYPDITEESGTSGNEDVRDLQYKWITFERNGSLFIAQFNTLDIINNEINTSFTELMKTPDKQVVPPRKVIVIDNGKVCFPADRTGKQIHGSYDFISPLIEPVEVTGNIIQGRIRIFGLKHLVLRYS